MPTQLPTDVNNNVIPAMRLSSTGAHSITTSSTSAHNATPLHEETKIISLYATTDVFIRFSNNPADQATSLDHFFPAGIYYDFATGENAYVHARSVNADGMLYLSEKK